VVAVTRRNVTESVVISVVGASFSVVKSAKDDLEILFEQAAHRQNTGKGERVFIEYRAASSGDTYRSELLHARLSPDAETASEGWIADAAMRFAVAWRRRFYWEGAETELALDNGSTGSKTTGGVTVYNHDDAGSGHDNWVDIDGDDVEGILPAPTEIQLLNSYNDTRRTSAVWLAANVFAAPGSFQHILEAEDVDYVAGSASPSASSTCSGGYRQAATWTSDSETRLFEWNLDAAFLANAKGNRFRVLARITSASSGVRLRLKVRFSSLTVVYEAPEMAVDSNELQDLGAVQLPPWLLNETDLAAVQLAIYGRLTGGGTVSLDFIQLTPLDSYRPLVPRGYGASYGTTLVDDGITPSLYVDWGGAGRVGHYVGHGQPVQVWPGRDQRVYVLVRNDIGNMEIDRTHVVRVWYRPRLATV